MSFLCCFKTKTTGPSTPPGSEGDTESRRFIRDALHRLESDPDDKTQQLQIESHLESHPSTVFSVLKDEAARLPSRALPATLSAPPTTSITDTGTGIGTAITITATAADGTTVTSEDSKDWTNAIGEQRCTPARKTRPQSLRELVSIISEARTQKLRVRAVGSGHAFSDVARTDGAVLVDPVLLNDVRAVDAAVLRAGVLDEGGNVVSASGGNVKEGRKLAFVQAGITVRALKIELENRGLALINMGGYDGQTISGTLATGTHGSGITFGPLASFARAIILVAETGVVYQIERSGERGISDGAKWKGTIDGVEAVLKQDDDWFRAAQVAMGCLGVIYGFVLEVAEAFVIKETRSSTTWADIKNELTPDKWAPIAPVVGNVDHFELVLNPYYRWFRNACVKVERTRLPGDTPSSGQRQDWLSALLERVAIQKAPDLVAFLTNIPFLSPLVIDQAIMTLVYNEPYIDKSYNIFSLGVANEIKGMALELHCDAKQCVPTIDKLLNVFQEQALKYMWYMAGPLGIRFVAASDAFLAPEAGRMTCTIELAMLVGLKTGKDLARRVKERMCTNDSTSVRVHWGLDMDFATDQDVRAWYPDFGRWHGVYKRLNSTGMFNNKFTDRLGISV